MELRRVLQGFHEKLDDLHPLSGTISHWHGGCFYTTQTTEGEFIWPHIHLQDVRIAKQREWPRPKHVSKSFFETTFPLTTLQ